MARLLIIGPGNMTKHITRLKDNGKIKNEKEYFSHFDRLIEWAKAKDLLLLPDRGTPVELARRAREKYGGNIKIIGAVPQDDKEFGIEHLMNTINIRVRTYDGDLPLLDRIINTGTWRDHHFIFSLLGDEILYLGHTSGTFYEIGNGYYLYKLCTGKKRIRKDVRQKELHPEVRAGTNVKYVTWVYEPFIVDRFPVDFEDAVKDASGEIRYFKV